MTSWSIQALGWAGSALLIFSLLQQRVLRFRLLNLTASCTLVVFNAMLHVWPMVGMNIVTAGINVWMITRLLRERGDESVYEVVAVGPDASYLQHFPQFRRRRPRPGTQRLPRRAGQRDRRRRRRARRG
jgi:hypothetical protein